MGRVINFLPPKVPHIDDKIILSARRNEILRRYREENKTSIKTVLQDAHKAYEANVSSAQAKLEKLMASVKSPLSERGLKEDSEQLEMQKLKIWRLL